jgi:hypothetical protein
MAMVNASCGVQGTQFWVPGRLLINGGGRSGRGPAVVMVMHINSHPCHDKQLKKVILDVN